VHHKSAYILLIFVAAMIVLGLVMLFSTGAFAQDSHGNPFYFVKRQGMWLGIGAVVCVIAACIDYHVWQRTWWIWFALSIVLLALCFVPPIGQRINGSWRWINLKFITFQPSELAKLAAVVFLAHWFSKYAQSAHQLLKGFLLPLCCVGVLMSLIAREVDLGTTALLAGTMFVMLFVAGTNLRYIIPIALAGAAGIFFAAINLRERLGRLIAFTDLEKYKEGAGLQQWQALIAFGSGGVDGLGLGDGRQKMLYLPFAHTDFIFPMIGEELGLRFTLLVVFGYLVFVLCGTVISLNARDRFGMLLGFGLTSIIALQAAMNIGVTTSLLPNKGLPLPFISYGGSNLVFCLLATGILTNIYRHGVGEQKKNVQLHSRVTPRI
jgi:cell division protein FtsW